MTEWLTTTWQAALAVLLSTVGVFAVVIAATRMYGLRSYSKMSGFDFAMTVALGTVAGSTLLSRDPALVQGIVAIASIFFVRWLASTARVHWPLAARLIDNRPMLLMKDGRILSDNLRRARVTESELMEKLREANVMHLREVRAVVLERAGEMSVLHGEGEPDAQLLADVKTT